jgi:outer membrane cobalamin receptor
MHKRMSLATAGFWLLANCLLAQASQATQGENSSLRGSVVDARTNAPLINANVVTVPAGAGASTDASGEFILKFSNRQRASFDSLRVTYLGYRPQVIAIPTEGENITIKLEAVTLFFSETVVTATRQAALRASLPAASELVKIEASNVTQQNVGEALASSQSVFVKEYGGVSGIKTISLRGAGDGQVLVLQDGVRLNNPQNGGVDAGVLSLVGIDKIEIIRGNASAQYGSDAIGGVVHLRTIAPPQGFSGTVLSSGGSFGTFNSRLQLGYGSAKWRGSVALDRLVSDGDFAFEDGATTKHRSNNGLQRREVFARLLGNPSNGMQVSIVHRTGKTEQGAPGSLQYPSAVANQQDLNHLTSAGIEWHSSSLLQLTAQFSAERRDRRYDNPEFSIASRHRVVSDIGVLQNRARLGSNIDVLMGAEIGNYRVNSTELGKPERTQRSAFFQTEWRPTLQRGSGIWQLVVIPSLRYDDYTDAGGRGSPKLAVALNRHSTSRFKLHAGFGKSFRVPSMDDLFWPAGQYEAGNPNLLPERGKEFEGGVLYEFSRAGNWQIEAGAFDSKVKDLIVWIPDANFLYSPYNVDDARISGGELGIAWRSNGDRIGWRAAYAYLSAKNDSDDSPDEGKYLVYRPRHKLDLQAQIDVRYFTISGSYQFVEKRFSNAANSDSLPSYQLAHFSLSRRMNFGEVSFLLRGEVRNVFDEHYAIIDGYPMPGREYRASVELSTF